MKYQFKLQVKSQWFIGPIIGGAAGWIFSGNPGFGIILFVALLLPPVLNAYIPYAKNNPKELWGPSLIISIFFFGISIIEAVQTQHWLMVVFWLAMGLVFLLVNFKKN